MLRFVFVRIHLAVQLSSLATLGQVAAAQHPVGQQFSHECGVVESPQTAVNCQIDSPSDLEQGSPATAKFAPEKARDMRPDVPDASLPLTSSASFMEWCAGPVESSSGCPPQQRGPGDDPSATPGNKSGGDSSIKPSVEAVPNSKPDFNRDIYYAGKREFSFEGGYLPINVPFPLDVFEGDPYNLYPLRYTLAPIFLSLRWHYTDIKGPVVLRGNWDATFTVSATIIPKGPETRYFSYIMGVRRNFVPRNWRVPPYWDLQLGMGDINAKGGVNGIKYAQGEDFTFTANMGAGVRYNFNPRYAISGGLHYMHISNAGLSGKKTNYGINVYGPMVGIDIQLPGHPAQSD